jgi:hypothetical protein
VTPTPTITNTPTVTPTATPTPVEVDVTFRLTIRETPIVGAPVQVNEQTKLTGANGEFVASLEKPTLYTISTGLTAIAFTPLIDTGTQFSSLSPVVIEAQRLVSSVDDPCRVFINAEPHIYFSTQNLTDQTLAVPLNYRDINQIYSVTGTAVPPELFPGGSSGFSVSESSFSSGSTLIGVWRFLGQEVVVKKDINLCADRGVPGQCELIDPDVLRIPYNHTRMTIMKLTQLSTAAARSGKWRRSGGKFNLPFISRGARALAYMKKALGAKTEESLTCEVVPMSCSIYRVPKKALVSSFAGIFAGRLPRGLEHISRRSKQEVATFQRVLRKVPDRLVVCDQR